MKRVLTVGITYAGDPIPGIEIENLGLCRAATAPDEAAFPLYEYDTIILNPQSFTHFLLGKAGSASASPNELSDLKRQNPAYDIDTLFDAQDRQKELEAALADGATVVWCMAEPKRMNFYGYRETHLGYLTPKVQALVKRGDLLVKKGRRIDHTNSDGPFLDYFQILKKAGWKVCLSDDNLDGYESIAETPEGYSLGGRVNLGSTAGWLVTPPTSAEAETQLVRDAIALEKGDPAQEKYHGIFLSHTAVDKPFVRRLRDDLLERGVPRVWLDEAEIEIGDSLINKIDEGLKLSRYIAVILSKKSIKAPWVKKELEIAINREIDSGEVVVLPLLYEACELPTFLLGKLYADFTKPGDYEEVLAKLLRRLRIR
ncbi:MAG: hypothetical protein QOH04_1512 [Sphingomonadales bacterium]|jgi:hypothetical protein|nr:hypothetical protein [Sphingomonadales bacterium]